MQLVLILVVIIFELSFTAYGVVYLKASLEILAA
jgi:hypothetical protein